MPVPPLPLELVQLICDHLEDPHLSQLDRVRTGTRIALTCRAWKGIGYRFSMRRIGIHLGLYFGTTRRFRQLLELLDTPVLLSYIEFLELNTDTRFCDPTARELPSETDIVRQLLGHTSSIRHLRISHSAVQGVRLLLDLASITLPGSLQTLHVNCKEYQPAAIDSVLATLARLPQLNSLALQVKLHDGPWTDKSVADAATGPSRLRLSHLEIRYLNIDVASSVLMRIRHAIHPELVRSLHLVHVDQDLDNFSGIMSTCVNVRDLRVVLFLRPFGNPSNIETGGFSRVCEAVKGLKDLQALSIQRADWNFDVRQRAPLRLDDFLALFALSIRRLDITCCHFEGEPLRLPLYSAERDGLIVRRLAKVGTSRNDYYGDDSADFEDLVEVQNLEGLVRWRRLPHHKQPPVRRSSQRSSPRSALTRSSSVHRLSLKFLSSPRSSRTLYTKRLFTQMRKTFALTATPCLRFASLLALLLVLFLLRWLILFI